MALARAIGAAAGDFVNVGFLDEVLSEFRSTFVNANGVADNQRCACAVLVIAGRAYGGGFTSRGIRETTRPLQPGIFEPGD